MYKVTLYQQQYFNILLIYRYWKKRVP